MFQNVLMTVMPLSETKEINCWENRPFIHRWPESNHQKKINQVTTTIKKKNKRNRTAYTTDQLRVLEKSFSRSKYVDVERRKELADYLKINEKCVKVWFQNRRMKEKKEPSESSNDSASECIAYEPITPPPVNQFQNNNNQYIQQNTSYIDPPGLSNNTTESQPSYYPIKEECEAFHRTSGIGYQYYVPLDYMNYSLPSHTNDYFRNDASTYPTQYYPCSGNPEYAYTNTDNNQYVQNQQSSFSEVSNWSASAIDLNYF